MPWPGTPPPPEGAHGRPRVGLDFLLEMTLAVALDGIIGIERELKDKPAGLRTHILICLDVSTAE